MAGRVSGLAEMSGGGARLRRMDDNAVAAVEVRLRDVVESDLEVFFEHEHAPEAVRRAKFAPRERERFMTHWATRVLGDPTVTVRTVTVDGEPAGSIVAWTEQDKRFVGYWFGQRYWGRGIGTCALTLFLRLEQTRPLYADPHLDNIGSIRVLEKCGFQRAEIVRHGEEEHLMLVLP